MLKFLLVDTHKEQEQEFMYRKKGRCCDGSKGII